MHWFGLVHRFFLVVNCKRKVNQWERAREVQSMVSYSETRPYTVVVAHTLGLVLRPKQILLLTRWKNSQAESVFFFFFLKLTNRILNVSS